LPPQQHPKALHSFPVGWGFEDLHPYVPSQHFDQFYCLLIARRGGTGEQFAERFITSFAVSFRDLVNLGKYPSLRSMVGGMTVYRGPYLIRP